MITTNKWQS